MNNHEKKYKLVPYLSKQKIDALCKDLAEQINEDYKEYVVNGAEEYINPQIVAICVLKGGMFFLTDILRYIKIPMIVDFAKLASYGKDMKSSGTITILQDISTDIKGKHIIIFDEIIDSGRTLSFYVDRLRSSEPASIKLCTLIDKKLCRSPESKIEADYVGINADEEFLIGYGLDHAEQYRNLPEIYQLKEM
ncbi:MAG: hypoxanthine phosphoribosyltransferase [bacterium]